jgi:predicted N-acetyltransferase YhbS
MTQQRENNMTITIRPEKPEDYRATEILTREAFWDLYRPGCSEHLVAHNLRKSRGFVEELDLVACEEDRIVGNIMYSKARVLSPDGEGVVLCLGPVSVLPRCQGRGIGGRLITESLARARALGFAGVFLMGHPAYYSRFGFQNAAPFGVSASDGRNYDHFMRLELAPGRLKALRGRFFEDEAFQVDAAELEEFEKLFPNREKHKLPTQIFE